MVGTQQFNLRWNNHTSNILQVFLEHLSSELLVDVTLSCQSRFIKAHKIILSACSQYFQHKCKYPNNYCSPKEARLQTNLKQDQILHNYLHTTTRIGISTYIKIDTMNLERKCNLTNLQSDKPDSHGQCKVNVYINRVDSYTDTHSSSYDDQDANADDIEECYLHDNEVVDDLEKADDPAPIFHETDKRTKHGKLNNSTRI